ncbi:type II toxin-antitoxin system RelE/ParE family toxin [Spirosoma spitsbergense]|jgi:plasmid stabilization system protein ParE|uniref:type II toxin-antitoxin system RelE/ParE family toxin n=1 Tax=Spirosoma spitsbergense TaxID=431554 RepID=UPI00036A9D90|nr:type II toxin-antitoxin system RelE/ParE family toxin [Spirosoma spitsbergense]
MAKQIIWAETTVKQFNSLRDYIEENRSIEAAIRFVDEFYRQLDIIDSQPYIGMSHAENSLLRKRLIAKTHYLYYLIEDHNTIRLLNIIDTRSGPDKNPFAF